MAFYDLSKSERQILVAKIEQELKQDLDSGGTTYFQKYFADDDTYIRKSAYLAVGRLHKSGAVEQITILNCLEQLLASEKAKVRQTVVNAAGEIGMLDFPAVQWFFDHSLFDQHHSVRNAVIGSVKKMGQKNPGPVLAWAKTYLGHPNKEIRREICHGIELRGRTHPEDILPLLRQLEHDKQARVRNTLVHVLGQIAYKKGCLEKVVLNLKQWENKDLVSDALHEIIDVHSRYRNFAHYTTAQAKTYIEAQFS